MNTAMLVRNHYTRAGLGRDDADVLTERKGQWAVLLMAWVGGASLGLD